APNADSPVRPIVQCLYFKACCLRIVHENGYLFAFYYDLGVKPRVDVWRWLNRLFILARLLRAELLPRPLWLGDVLDGVARVFGILSAKVEGPEIDAIICGFIHSAKRDPQKVAAPRRALPQDVTLDRAVREVQLFNPYHGAGKQRGFAFDISV